MFRLTLVVFAVAVMPNASRGADQPAKSTAILALDVEAGTVRELASFPDYPIINSPEISADGRRVAVDGWKADESLQDAHVLIVNIDGTGFQDLGPGAMPTFSPGGHRVVISRYSNERGVWVLNLNGAEPILIEPEGWSGRWSPDGRQLAWTTRRGGGATIEIVDIIEGLRHTVFEGDERTRYSSVLHNFCWSPDSTAICFKGLLPNGGQEIAIVDARGSSHGFRVRLSGDTAAEFNPDIAWHPDGSRIAVPKRSAAGARGQIYVFDPRDDEPPARLDGQPADRANSGMCWSPDGKTLIFLSRP